MYKITNRNKITNRKDYLQSILTDGLCEQKIHSTCAFHNPEILFVRCILLCIPKGCPKIKLYGTLNGYCIIPNMLHKAKKTVRGAEYTCLFQIVQDACLH